MNKTCGFEYGEEGGIRTLETLRFTHFPGVRLRPLGHLSKVGKNKLPESINQVILKELNAD